MDVSLCWPLLVEGCDRSEADPQALRLSVVIKSLDGWIEMHLFLISPLIISIPKFLAKPLKQAKNKAGSCMERNSCVVPGRVFRARLLCF